MLRKNYKTQKSGARVRQRSTGPKKSSKSMFGRFKKKFGIKSAKNKAYNKQVENNAAFNKQQADLLAKQFESQWQQNDNDAIQQKWENVWEEGFPREYPGEEYLPNNWDKTPNSLKKPEIRKQLKNLEIMQKQYESKFGKGWKDYWISDIEATRSRSYGYYWLDKETDFDEFSWRLRNGDESAKKERKRLQIINEKAAAASKELHDRRARELHEKVMAKKAEREAERRQREAERGQRSTKNNMMNNVKSVGKDLLFAYGLSQGLKKKKTKSTTNRNNRSRNNRSRNNRRENFLKQDYSGM